MGVATERVVGSIFPGSEEKTRLCASLCHFVAHFDPDATDIISSAKAHPHFCHQYVDSETFRPRKCFALKKSQIFWVGKLKVGDFAEAYQDRIQLFNKARDMPGFIWREATNPEKSIGQIVREKDTYQGLLNLPSNCPGFTSNFFENLAMGGCVLQHDVSSPHPGGLEPGVHYLGYERNQPESLACMCEKLLKDPGSHAKMAFHGQQVCLEQHKLSDRLKELFHCLQERCFSDSFCCDAVSIHALARIVRRMRESP
jgi:hypothetical protein